MNAETLCPRITPALSLKASTLFESPRARKGARTISKRELDISWPSITSLPLKNQCRLCSLLALPI